MKIKPNISTKIGSYDFTSSLQGKYQQKFKEELFMLLMKQTDQLIRNERSNAKFIDSLIANVVSLTDSLAKKQLEYDATIEFTNKPASDPPADSVEYIFPAVPSVYNPIVAIHHYEDLFQFELQDG